MATKLRVAAPGGAGEYETTKTVADVANAVNTALQTNKKFFALPLANGKKRAFVASDVLSIWEE